MMHDENYDPLAHANNCMQVVFTCSDIQDDLDGLVEVNICEPSGDGSEVKIDFVLPSGQVMRTTIATQYVLPTLKAMRTGIKLAKLARAA